MKEKKLKKHLDKKTKKNKQKKNKITKEEKLIVSEYILNTWETILKNEKYSTEDRVLLRNVHEKFKGK